MLSVNTNYGALVALQNLNSTNKLLTETQNRINTGLKVSGPKDDGAVFAIAQQARGKLGGYGVAADTVDKAISTLDVAISAGNAISDLLIQLKVKATAATDTATTRFMSSSLVDRCFAGDRPVANILLGISGLCHGRSRRVGLSPRSIALL